MKPRYSGVSASHGPGRWRALPAIALAAFGLLAALPARASEPPQAGVATSAPARHASFFVGGRYEGAPGQEVMQGAVAVEMFAPERVEKPWPLVFFHGAAQTSVNWLGTPDGRTGWADFFVRQGYVVYVVDQPARGRSAYHAAIDGPLRNFSAPFIEKLFTASAQLGTWPQAKLHTQWPGGGRMGDAVFDAFYRTQVEFLPSNAATQKLVQAAGAALLDRIGPAILVTHSQAGAFGWLIADMRPSLVKSIVALEPLGPPFQDAVLGTAPSRPWGVTDIPMTYDPPVEQASDLATVRQDTPDRPNLEPCRLQAEPARRLPRLSGIPILVVAAEASYHAVYDHCTARYLSQAGATVDFQRLEDHGIRGNGHMLMLEKNSDEIAGFVAEWMGRHVPGPASGR